MEHSFEISNFASLSIEESFNILEILILNKKINGSGATHLCFALFDRILLHKLYGNSNDIGYNQLRILMKYIKKLVIANRFSRKLFLDLLHSKCNNKVPFEVLWWLEENNNISHLEQHWETTNPSFILDQLLSMLKNDTNISDDAPHNPKSIACDFLFKIISYNYTMFSKNSLTLNSNWNHNCFVIFNDFVSKSVQSYLDDMNNNILVQFIKAVKKKQGLNKTILKYLYRNFLNTFFLSEDKAVVYDAYVMQELWSTKSLHENTILFFYQIVKRFDFIELNNYFMGEINWKYALIIISMFASNFSNSQQQLKGFVQNCIQNALNDRNAALLQTAFLVQRQICFESGQVAKSYSEWYAKTFGMNSNLKTASDKHIFAFLLGYMHMFITYEPEYALKVHIERSLRVPLNCQTEMLQFKDLCRVQWARMQQSPVIEIIQIKFPLICVLELVVQCKNYAWLLRQKEITPLILPYLIGDTKFDWVKEAMLEHSSLNQARILNCKPAEYEIRETPVFNDSQDMFE